MESKLTPLLPILRQRRDLLLGGLGLLGGSALAQAVPEPSGASAERSALPLPPIGTVLHVPSLSLLDGSAFRPERAQGQVLVIYWWASTCPFCALQSPEIQKLWLAHKDRGLQMLALSVDRKPADASVYLQKKGYTFPAGWVTPEVQRLLPKPRGLPVTLVRGRASQVMQAERGQMFAEEVEQLARWL
jgi:hypothetical protein